MFKRIDHVELLTGRPEEVVRFHTEVLGFKIRSRDRIPVTPTGPLDLTYLDLGGTTVELMCYPEARPEPAPSGGERLGYRMMALEVEDMQRALEHLAAKGIRPVWGPKTREQYARAEICDPDGNHIELRQWF
jgi:glyoxylase I family protein